MLSDLWIRLRALFRRKAVETELDDELRFHFDGQVEKFVQSGVSLHEARRRARLTMGGSDQIKEECRDARGVQFLDTFAQDFRYGIRTLRKNPSFTAVAILTLVLGIGANTAIFSLIHALLIRNLPVYDAGRLVAISRLDQNGEGDGLLLPQMEEIKQQQQVFSSIFGWWGGAVYTTEIDGELSQTVLDGVTGEYYSALGVEPLVGRLIMPDDVPLSGGTPPQVVVLGYGFWQRRFGGDPTVIGRALRIEGIPFTVIGVTPKGFLGLAPDTDTQVTVPFTTVRTIAGTPQSPRPFRFDEVVARLHDGVTPDQARRQLETLWPGIRAATVPAYLTPTQRQDFLADRLQIRSAATGFSFMRARFSKPLEVLMVISGLVLLLACVNLATLLLARASTRQHEMGIRLVLGASRWRLTRQLLTESVLLSVAGAIAALPLAWWASSALAHFVYRETYSIPATLIISPDPSVLGLTIGIAILIGVLFGLVPARVASRRNPSGALKHASRSHDRGTGKMGKILVTLQVALSLILLGGAGLFIRSLENLRAFNPGFDTNHVLVARLIPKPNGYKNLNVVSYYHEMTQRLASLPGVESVTLSHLGPGGGLAWKQDIGLSGVGTEILRANFTVVAPEYFATLGIQLLEGRNFTWDDGQNSQHVAIVSATLARRLFPVGDAMGRHIRGGTDPKQQNLEIVGIVSDARIYDIHDSDVSTVYVPLMQQDAGFMEWPFIEIRTRLEGQSIRLEVQQVVASLGREYLSVMYTHQEWASRALLQERVLAMIAGVFGVLGLVLAAIGLYGLMAFTVTRRTREIGLRMALGASRSGVLWMILRDTVTLALAGIAVGLLCALAATRFIAHMLFGLSAKDPVTLVVISVMLIVMAVIAGWFPARRATRVDPMVALRHE